MDEEKKKSRKEWIKTAAIVFLSIMLVLTFFSNTFMNYSLPEVAVQSAASGTITAKIRGTGTVESGDPYNVMVKQVRKVESIEVRVGDAVQKGDVLFILTDEESEELKNAKKALEDAQSAYDQALLNADVTSQIVAQSQTGTSAATYRAQITAAQLSRDNAEKALEKVQKEYDAINKKISELDSGISASESDIAESKESLDKAEAELNEAILFVKQLTFNLQDVEYQRNLKKADMEKKQTNYENTVSSNDLYGNYKDEYEKAKKLYEEAEATYSQAEANLETAKERQEVYQTLYDALKQAYENKSGTEKTALEAEKIKKELELSEKKENLEKKTEALNELTTDISKTLGLENLYKAIADAKEAYEKVLTQSVDSVVTAGVAGTITAINVSSGKETNTLDPAVVIQPEGKGYYLSFSVTNDQAKRLSVGDVADLVNSWRYDDVNVVLSSIKPDKNNPGQNKLLTFDISGDVTPGQSLSLSVGQKSANYDAIVPNSAIREDNNGKFVLIVESKSSPLGNRYVATRMDVQVLASDDTQSAVNGLYGYEYVITTTTKPVEAGQLVRLSNSN